MREPGDMSCEAFDGVAAELALGVLTGRERAAALEHLDRCGTCRQALRQLAMTGEELLGLLPAVEPPPGFETRVLARLGVAAPARGSHAPGGRPARTGFTRRALAAAAVALAVLGAAAGGWAVRAATDRPAGSPLRTAALLTAGRLAVGKVFLYNGSPRWVYMSVYLGSATGRVTCQLVGGGGRVITVGTFLTDDGYAAWGSPDPAGTGPVTGARLVSANGTILATASFT